jgi:two-component system cell cycle response regulator DivK
MIPEKVYRNTNFGKILVVEDNDLCFKVISHILKYRGFTVYRSATGLDVRDLIWQNRPDLILMDIQLPEVLGTDLIRCIKADDDIRSIPIVATTAYAIDEEGIRESGCDAFLAKPLDLNVLLAVVNRLLSIHPMKAGKSRLP